MCVDRSVARSAREILVLAVRDVLVRARVAILLGEAEINDVNHVLALAQADQEAATGRRVRSESEFRGAGDGGARAGAIWFVTCRV